MFRACLLTNTLLGTQPQDDQHLGLRPCGSSRPWLSLHSASSTGSAQTVTVRKSADMVGTTFTHH